MSTATGATALADQLGDAAAFQQTDVADADQVQAAVDLAVGRFGGLHVMCNNAGVGGSYKRFLDDDFADFDRVMAVNIFGVMIGMQRAARHMADHGGGAIVNTTSIGGINAGGGVMAYRATKAAVIHVTRSVAIELGAQEHPSELHRARAHPDRNQCRRSTRSRSCGPCSRCNGWAHRSTLPRRRCYLASDRAAQITGVVLPVDGGTTAGPPPRPMKDLLATPASSDRT